MLATKERYIRLENKWYIKDFQSFAIHITVPSIIVIRIGIKTKYKSTNPVLN